MAIYHLSSKFISRAKGSSAVAAAAYRHAAKMVNERQMQTVSYESKSNVAHTEVAMPRDVQSWLSDKLAGKGPDQQAEALWNAVEKFEKRKDAQLARETVIALPKELTAEQNIELAREFVTSLTARGQVADWAFHNEPGNPHVHIMTTLRAVTEDGFGPKRITVLGENGAPMTYSDGKRTRGVYKFFNGEKDDLKAERALWQDLANAHLLKYGHSETIDHRSFADRGIELQPTVHRGPVETYSEALGEDRTLQLDKIKQQNTALLMERPEILLEQLTDNMSVFDADDIARKVHTYVQDVNVFKSILAQLVNSDELVRLTEEVKQGRETVKAKYTTRSMIDLERGMADRALGMKGSHTHQVSARRVQAAIKKAVEGESYQLSEQQAGAVHSITGPQQLASIVGLAGAGKSTLLKAANLAWKAQGYNPMGLSLAGKAVDELEKTSGIEGRTIASLEYRLKHGMQTITEKDVLVVDEAGMVGSKQLDKLLATAQAAGAKVVLVGDYDQLPAISAGAAFRAIVERTGYYEVSEIHRQSAAWMKQASLDFARGNIKEALGAYQENLAIGGFKLQDEAFDALAADFVTKHKTGEMTLALAHSNKTVQELNDRIRSNLKQSGDIGQDFKFETAKSIEDRREDRAAHEGQTPEVADYRYDFGEGDRIVFLQNDTIDGVKVRNGQLGRVIEAKEGHLAVELENGERVAFGQDRYNHISHGFAVTIYKSQGVTVDNTLVLAQRSMTQNLAYVAMTRHKKSAQMYYGKMSFPRKLFKGGIVEALSRPAAKSTTLDYEGTIDYQAAVGFGQRRGFNPSNTIIDQMKAFTRRQVERLAKLGERLGSFTARLSIGVKDQAIADLVPPMPMPMSKSQWIEAAFKKDARMAQVEETLRVQVEKIFKDGPSVFEKLRQKALDPNLDQAGIEALERQGVYKYGDLKGETLLVRLSKKKVEGLNKSLSYASRLVGRLAKARISVEQRAGRHYDSLEAKLKIAIPGLSVAERDELLNLAKKVAAADEKKTRIYLDRDHAEILAKAKTIEEAASRRFGSNGLPRFMSNHVERPDDKVRQALLDNHSEIFKAAWTLMSAEKGWNTNLKHSSKFNRDKDLGFDRGLTR